MNLREVETPPIGIKRFPGCPPGKKYVAVLKSDRNIVFNDYTNKSGALIHYIKEHFDVDVPSQFKRARYRERTGMEWYEQYWDIVQVDDIEKPVKKCPYCDWSTHDVNNLSGAFVSHIQNVHGMTRAEYLKEYPEDKEYLRLVNRTLQRAYEDDKSKFVTCAICGKKLARIDWRHLSKHGITKEEYKWKYCQTTVSDELHGRLSKIITKRNEELAPSFTSRAEQEIRDWLTSNGVEFETNNRKVLQGKELDIYIPSMNIAIEYNGIYWHSEGMNNKDRYSHLRKLEACLDKGIALIQIFEDEYVFHKDLVYEKLEHLLKFESNKERVAARRCRVVEIHKDVAKEFLDKFHIQESAHATIYLGAYYGNRLVGVMAFKKMDDRTSKFELVRFATDFNYICQGLGGKLFSHFINNYNPSEVKTFADRRWTISDKDNLYVKLGFAFDGYVAPDYMYYCDKISRVKRLHKFNFRKTLLHKRFGFPLTMTEREMTDKLGCRKVWNAGLIRYIWKREVELT